MLRTQRKSPPYLYCNGLRLLQNVVLVPSIACVRQDRILTISIATAWQLPAANPLMHPAGYRQELQKPGDAFTGRLTGGNSAGRATL